MAATATAPRAPAIKLEYGQPQTLTVKYVESRALGESKYPPFLPQAMFSFDEGPLFLEAEDASDVERSFRELGIKPGQQVGLVKIRHPHGGGHSYRVTRMTPAAEPARDARFEEQLEGSIRLADQKRRDKAELIRDKFIHDAAPVVRKPAAAANRQDATAQDCSNTTVSQASGQDHDSAASAASAKFREAYRAAIDTLIAAKAYAQNKGLALEIRCEDVRCLAATFVIQANGAAR